MNIIVVYGGNSPEKEVSASSAKEISQSLESLGHKVVCLNLIEKNFEENEISDFNKLYKFVHSEKHENVCLDSSKEISDFVLSMCKLSDIVFLSTHGGIGEDGRLQAVFEIEHVPFTGNNHFSVALSMNKRISKLLVENKGLKIPKEYEYSSITKENFPLIIKPNDNGSSIGVRVIENIDALPEFNANTIYEEMVFGREFSVGIIGEEVLPPIEVIVKEGFYDYHKKYTPGAIEEVCPADISIKLSRKLKDAAMLIHKLIGFEVYSRIDFMVDSSNVIYFIEANSVPGMTPTSLLPQEMLAVGKSHQELCKEIINLSRNKKS